MIHNFNESVRKSENRAADTLLWQPLFERHFPDMESFEYLSYSDNPELQKLGVDWRVHFPGGTTVTVDDKVRESHFPDVALEYWSNKESKIRGWVCKPVACDYFLYVWPSGTSILLPSKLLRIAWRKYGKQWVRQYEPPIEAKNYGYTTISVGVPVNVLCGALVESMLAVPRSEPVVRIPDSVPPEQFMDYLLEHDEWLPEELRGSA